MQIFVYFFYIFAKFFQFLRNFWKFILFFSDFKMFSSVLGNFWNFVYFWLILKNFAIFNCNFTLLHNIAIFDLCWIILNIKFWNFCISTKYFIFFFILTQICTIYYFFCLILLYCKAISQNSLFCHIILQILIYF